MMFIIIPYFLPIMIILHSLTWHHLIWFWFTDHQSVLSILPSQLLFQPLPVSISLFCLDSGGDTAQLACPQHIHALRMNQKLWVHQSHQEGQWNRSKAVEAIKPVLPKRLEIPESAREKGLTLKERRNWTHIQRVKVSEHSWTTITKRIKVALALGMPLHGKGLHLCYLKSVMLVSLILQDPSCWKNKLFQRRVGERVFGRSWRLVFNACWCTWCVRERLFGNPHVIFKAIFLEKEHIRSLHFASPAARKGQHPCQELLMHNTSPGQGKEGRPIFASLIPCM